jgi:hypothetical protein
MKRSTFTPVVALFLACLASPAFAQGNPAVQLTAKVTKVQGGKLFITAPQGDYLVQVNADNSAAVLTGIVAGDALRAGLSVEFTAALDEKNQAKAEVKEIRVFTPSKSIGYSIGLPKDASGKRMIRGKISKVSEEGLLTLTIPGEDKVQFTPAMDAAVSLQMKLSEPLALKLLKPGDTVLLLGLGTAPKGKTPGRVKADSIFVRREAEPGKSDER